MSDAILRNLSDIIVYLEDRGLTDVAKVARNTIPLVERLTAENARKDAEIERLTPKPAGDDACDDLHAVAWLCEKRGHKRSATACRKAAAELNRLEAEIERLTLEPINLGSDEGFAMRVLRTASGRGLKVRLESEDGRYMAWLSSKAVIAMLDKSGPIATPLEPATGEGEAVK